MNRSELKREKKRCRACGERRALSRYRGVVKWRKHCTLCFRCFRAELNRSRRVAEFFAEAPPLAMAA